MIVRVFDSLLTVEKRNPSFQKCCYSFFSEQIDNDTIFTVKCFEKFFQPQEECFFRNTYFFEFYINDYKIENLENLYNIFWNNNFHKFDVFWNVKNKVLYSYTKKEKDFFINMFAIPKSMFYKNADLEYIQEEQKYCILNNRKFCFHNIKNKYLVTDLVFKKHASQKIIKFLKLIYFRCTKINFVEYDRRQKIYNNLTTDHIVFCCKSQNCSYIFIVENKMVHMFYEDKKNSHIYNGTLHVYECFDLFPIKKIAEDFKNQYELYHKLRGAKI